MSMNHRRIRYEILHISLENMCKENVKFGGEVISETKWPKVLYGAELLVTKKFSFLNWRTENIW